MRTTVCLVVHSALLLVATGCRQVLDTEPPHVRYGQDVCAQCSMIISEERFASAIVMQSDDGTFTKSAFDDINCLFEFEQSLKERQIVTRYVHDHESLGWIAMSDAWFIRSESIRTPMASGVAAFAVRALAEAKLAELAGGEMLDDEALSGHFCTSGQITKER